MSAQSIRLHPLMIKFTSASTENQTKNGHWKGLFLKCPSALPQLTVPPHTSTDILKKKREKTEREQLI